MNGKGVFQADKGALNVMKWVGKFAKNTAQKTHNCNNLAKLNDAKCTI